MRTLAGVAVLWLVSSWALATEVYKCTDADGRSVFSDKPCGDAAEKIRLRTSPVDTLATVEFLNVVWESLWQGSGYLQRMSKWDQPIRVKFSGASVDRHRELVLRQLRRVADIAGIQVTEVAGDATGANLEVVFIDARVNVPKDKLCWANMGPPAAAIKAAKITLHESSVKWCSLHEAMHVMGIVGHPHANSALSYFVRSHEPTEIDNFILKGLYSDEMKAGMYSLTAMEMYAKRYLDRFPSVTERAAKEKVVKKFLAEIVKQLESFAWGPGTPPAAVLKSKRATAEGLDWGRVEAQFLLGLVYTSGQIVEADHKTGFGWFARAASSAHVDAQFYMGEAYYQGRGVERDVVEAYKWYSLAARNKFPAAKTKILSLGKELTPQQISQGKARVTAWTSSPRKVLAIPSETAID